MHVVASSLRGLTTSNIKSRNRGNIKIPEFVYNIAVSNVNLSREYCAHWCQNFREVLVLTIMAIVQCHWGITVSTFCKLISGLILEMLRKSKHHYVLLGKISIVLTTRGNAKVDSYHLTKMPTIRKLIATAATLEELLVID